MLKQKYTKIQVLHSKENFSLKNSFKKLKSIFVQNVDQMTVRSNLDKLLTNSPQCAYSKAIKV